MWQSYFIEFVLSNITQLKVKSKAHPQNHSSGINMRQTHSITWKQQGYVGNFYFGKATKFMCFFASLPSSYCFYFFRRNNHLTRITSSHALFAQIFKGERKYICFKNFSKYEMKLKFELEGVICYSVCPTILRPKDKQ